MNNKYTLVKTDTTLSRDGRTLFRLRARVNFGAVVKGELGGYVESENNVEVSGNAWVSGDTQVYGNARVSGDARVSGNARVSGDAQVSGNAWVYGDAQVYGNAQVSGNAWVYGNADLLVITPIGSRKATATFTKSDQSVATGCFRGTIGAFAKAVVKTHGDNRHAKAYLAAIELAKIIFGLA